MTKKHKVMPHVMLESDTGFREPPYVAPADRFDQPALPLMTDFTAATPITAGPDVLIDQAREKMRRHNVHLLIIVDDDFKIVGKVTAMEIESEKPIQVANERRIARAEIRVRHIMTPQNEIHALEYDDVRKAEVGHVVATLNYLQLKHILVVETDAQSGAQVVRGVFSRTQIGAQLGLNLNLLEVDSGSLAERWHRK